LERITHPSIRLLSPEPAMTSVWHLFPVLVHEELRDRFATYLKSCGIMTGVHYPRIISEQTALRKGSWHQAAEPKNARRFAQGELSLPIHPFLTDQEVETVIAACNNWKADRP
jgi:dTDP-3-amino-3,4,6-trideoxy-alpha-D-glucose transaminase